MSTVELRPLGIGEILDVAIKIYFRHFSTFLKIALVVVLPTQVVLNAITVSATDTSIDGSGPFNFNMSPGQDSSVHVSAAQVGAIVAALVISFLASQLATGACFKAVADGYLGGEPDWRGSVSRALRRLHSMIWIAIVGGFVTVIGLVLCIVPGVWLLVGFAVAVPVLFSEDARGWKALSRSRDLVKGRWWPTCGLLVVGGILAAVLSAVITGVLGALDLATSGNWAARFVIGVLSGTLVAVLTTPFSAAYHTILYVDLRVRKEGLDLALFAQGIGSEPPPAAPPAWGFGGDPPAS
jgi:hypothetical protein